MFLRIFVERPILSGVLAVLILLAGAVSIPILPIAQYPQIAPPTVTVTSTYIGADAATVESAVTNTLEEQLNGVQGLRYMSSTSSNAGVSSITLTFDPARSVDLAAVDVQNRVQDAQGELPAAVTQTGVQITKSAGSFIMAIAFTSKNPNVTPLELSNFLDRNVKDPLLRINGVSSATIFGERRYAMRIWLDPRKLQYYGLGASDVTTAVSNQNIEVPAGSVGAEPALPGSPQTINLHVPGQLADAAAFGNIIVKSGVNASLVRLSQVARIELGAQDYSTSLRFDGKTALGIGIQLNSGANALSVANDVRSTLEGLKSSFPEGVEYFIPYDTTLFVRASLHEVIITLIVAILLVVATIYLFLQDLRTTLIPVITIPISLIGTFAFVNFFGFSINTLVLFGLTLASGLVVDDAIVVIENIARNMCDSENMNTHEATVKGLGEIVGAVIATSLVLLAVFIPTAMIQGTTGAIYKQFALTIAFSISISMVLALTLTPALAALLMGQSASKPQAWIFRSFNTALEALTKQYGRALGSVVRLRYLVAAGLVGLLALTYVLFIVAPSGFLPDEDQGAIIGIVQAPDGASLNVTNNAIMQMETSAFANPNVEHMFAVGGYSFNGAATNQGIFFVTLKPWDDRKADANSAQAIIGDLFPKAMRIPQASVVLINPPSIPGLGVTGGFDFELEDYQSGPLPQLAAAAGSVIGPANADPNLARVYTTFRATGPQINAVVNRTQVAQLGASLPNIFSDISTALGSTYVNNFTYENRTYRVYVQNDQQFRKDALDISRIAVPNGSVASTGGAASLLTNPTIGTTGLASIGSGTAMVPLASLVDVSPGTGAPAITHYNLHRSVEIQGNASPGHSSGQAMAAMDRLVQKLPAQFHHDWTGISLDELDSGGTTLLIFGLALFVVYLVLAALYESLSNPLVILLSVPAALLGAVGALLLRHITSDVYAQIGYVMLIGLAAKNAILIVEFAIQERATGKSATDAVIAAAQTRLRPILMTSVAFIAGLLPLVFASGAGSTSRHSLGTAVVGGMIVSTILNLIMVPAIYLIVEDVGSRFRGLMGRKTKQPIA